jgi:hypothetical protein
VGIPPVLQPVEWLSWHFQRVGGRNVHGTPRAGVSFQHRERVGVVSVQEGLQFFVPKGKRHAL